MSKLIIFACLIAVSFAATTTTPRPIDSKRPEISRAVRIQLAHKKASSRFLLGEFQDVASGAILNARWILTTAHNLDDTAGKSLRVIFDPSPSANNISTFFPKSLSQTAQIYKIKNQFVHPKWHQGTKSLPAENDIALVELEEPIEFPKEFKPFYLESLEVEEVSEIHKLPKHVSEITFYQDQATTPVNKMKTFTDFRCLHHPLDSSFTKERICGHVCSILTGSPLFEKRDRDHDVLFGIVQLEVLPCDKAPVSVYTSVTPYVHDFIKGHIPKNDTLYFITK